MRTRNNKLINFILEISQVVLVFLGVYSALMCMAVSLELSFDRLMCMLIMLVASFLFYGLFTVLETFHRGKLYGLLGITLFFSVIIAYFRNPVKKGFVTLVNSFLKEFMDYSGSKLTLLSYSTEGEEVTVYFCTTLILALMGVYLIVIVSAFFYRRRRSAVFLSVTAPVAFLSLVVGRVGYFSNVFTYLIVAMSVIGTRHLKTDATDRRMRQKLSILLMVVGLAAGAISYLVMPPQRYEEKREDMTETQKSVKSLMTWSGEDIFSWIKAYFNEDTMDYGRIGGKKEVTYTGEPVLKISGTVNDRNGMYLKGYVGDLYVNNEWSARQDKEYLEERKELADAGRSPDNWHMWMRNNYSGSPSGTQSDYWATAMLRIRNVGLGYGNYVVPYLPTTAFLSEEDGKTKVGSPGIDYSVEYYLVFPYVLRHDFLQGKHTLVDNRWDDYEAAYLQLEQFAKKYYLQVPDSLEGICNEFKQYLNENNKLYDRFVQGQSSVQDILDAVKTYITRDTEYTLSPGETPSGRDAVEYFLKENKKGYCTYYATAATILLRSTGIPARYVEGMHISPEELSKATEENKEILVPDSDAHAWVEVFDQKYGFVPVEVTPGVGEDDMTQSSDPQEEDPLDQDPQKDEDKEQKDEKDEKKEEPQQATPTPAVTEVPEESMIFDDIQGNNDDGEGGSAGSAGSASSRTLTLLVKIGVILALVVLAIEGERRIRRYLYIRSLQKLRMKRRIRRAHRHLMPVFNARGAAYRGQSMADYTMAIAEAMDLSPEQVADYVSIVFHARFGPDDITEAQYAGFRMQYDMIRHRMYENAKIIKKLYYMYIMVL
ncbi:MAG: hypothetical protein J6C32_08460 [Eubacterium sp.]|nr:hypothetical protein [Eubacterium sp.]